MQLRKKKECPSDWNITMYVLIYKKEVKKECGNLLPHKIIALISHADNVTLGDLQKILEAFLIPELPIEQAGFRRGRGTRDHIANITWIKSNQIKSNQIKFYFICVIFTCSALYVCIVFSMDHCGLK